MFVIQFVVFSCILMFVKSAILKALPPSLQDEVNLTAPEIIAKYKYPVEVHNVITEDGYILTLHRIPRQKPKGCVLVMHGIVASSADWIITGPENSLGYYLYDEGYDVWLGNVRGNRYSRNHTNLDPDSKEFWDFSWHEIGVYDLPAMIDYIIKITDESKIFYIGHSQGTTAFYVMCSTKPEYNSKIRAQFSLAPVAFVNHMFSPILHLLATKQLLLKGLAYFFHLNELLPKNGLFSLLGQKLCGVNAITEVLCSNTLFAICGFNYKQLNTTILPLILAHVPAGCATKQLLHYAQGIVSGHFRQYDYGFFTNLARYHQILPPDYDLSKITANLYFFYSKNDWISSAIDVIHFSKQMRNVKGKFLVSDDNFNHMDYIFGIQARKLVYFKIISLMNRH